MDANLDESHAGKKGILQPVELIVMFVVIEKPSLTFFRSHIEEQTKRAGRVSDYFVSN